MTSPSTASASADGASAWRAQASSIMLAGLGAFIALALVGMLARKTVQPWILGSFGATCVLLFGFPASPFSQPRNIIGGHVLTSLTGLLCLHLFGPGYMPMAAAVACALRCRSDATVRSSIATILATRPGIRFHSLLGRLRKLRNGVIEANPPLRTGGVDVQHGFEVGGIVQRRKPDRSDLRVSRTLREQGGSTVRAKTTGGEATTACRDCI